MVCQLSTLRVFTTSELFISGCGTVELTLCHCGQTINTGEGNLGYNQPGENSTETKKYKYIHIYKYTNIQTCAIHLNKIRHKTNRRDKLSQITEVVLRHTGDSESGDFSTWCVNNAH